MKAGSIKRLQTPVLIVGGGPSGMTAALCLAACGIASTVVEKRDSPARHPKAHEISARTIEILTSLGVSMKQMIAESSPHEDASRILFCRTLGEELGRIDLGAKPVAAKYAAHTATERPYLNLSQTELEKILRRKVLATKKIRLLSGVEWLSFRQNAEGVISLVRDARQRSTTVPEGTAPMQIHSQYLLACDGAGGRCRSALGIAMSGPEKIQDFANAYFTDDLRSRLKTPAKLFFIFKPDAAGTFIAHHAGRRWVYHVPVMTPHERLEDYTTEVFQERIAKALGDPGFKAHIESISSWRMTAQVAETFQSGRCFLVGDAAHRFPPTGGLGLNSGVADAHNLAWKIAAILNNEAAEDLATTYETERKSVVKINCDESRRNYFRLYEIPRALGLNAALMPRLMAVLNSAPLRWFGYRIQRAVLNFFYALADRRLARFWKNPRLAARTRSAIQDQHEHFDRIGLDLGYTYSAGAVVQDGEKAQFSAVADYRPSFAPGARLPVFYWKAARGKRVSTDVLRYDRFTLFVPETAAAAWSKAVRQTMPRTSVTVQPLPSAIVVGGVTTGWLDMAGEALLVRPDGHVAVRLSAANVSCELALHRSFTQLGYRNRESLSERRLAS